MFVTRRYDITLHRCNEVELNSVTINRTYSLDIMANMLAGFKFQVFSYSMSIEKLHQIVITLLIDRSSFANGIRPWFPLFLFFWFLFSVFFSVLFCSFCFFWIHCFLLRFFFLLFLFLFIFVFWF